MRLDEIASLLKQGPNTHSIHSEADLIYFTAIRDHFPKITFQDYRVQNFPKTTPPQEQAIFEKATEYARRRNQGIPLQHVLGWAFFYEHEYAVAPGVLIPRPETEILLDVALQNLPKTAVKGAELGIGSGILSIEILKKFPLMNMVASDVNPKAIELSKKNALSILGGDLERLRIQPVDEKIPPLQAFLDDAPFDFFISNPPYLSRSDEMDRDTLEHEPDSALFVGRDAHENPQYFYEEFAIHLPKVLKPGGFFFFEISHDRVNETLSLFQTPDYSNVRLENDLTGRPRVLWGIYKKN